MTNLVTKIALDNFAMRLRIALAYKGMNRNQLSVIVGRSNTLVSKWTLGKCGPNHGDLPIIAAALSMPVDWFTKGRIDISAFKEL